MFLALEMRNPPCTRTCTVYIYSVHLHQNLSCIEKNLLLSFSEYYSLLPPPPPPVSITTGQSIWVCWHRHGWHHFSVHSAFSLRLSFSTSLRTTSTSCFSQLLWPLLMELSWLSQEEPSTLRGRKSHDSFVSVMVLGRTAVTVCVHV